MDNRIAIDINMAHFDIINYKIVNNIYKSQTNVINELTSSGLNVTDSEEYLSPQSIELLSHSKIPFRRLFNLYCEIKDSQPMLSLSSDYRLELIENINSLVRESYEKLGRDKVIKMNYHQSNIRREIIKLSNKGDDYKIASLIEESMPYHIAIPAAKVKAELQLIYNQLGFKRTAKATDLMA